LMAQGGAEGGIRFSLPALIARGIYPKDMDGSLDFKVGTRVITKRSNEDFSTFDTIDWEVYSSLDPGEIAGSSYGQSDVGGNAYFYVSATGDVFPQRIYGFTGSQEYHFGLIHQKGPLKKSNWYESFFGGLASGTTGQGYFAKLFSNRQLSHSTVLAETFLAKHRSELSDAERVNFASSRNVEDFNWCDKHDGNGRTKS